MSSALASNRFWLSVADSIKNFISHRKKIHSHHPKFIKHKTLKSVINTSMVASFLKESQQQLLHS